MKYVLECITLLTITSLIKTASGREIPLQVLTPKSTSPASAAPEPLTTQEADLLKSFRGWNKATLPVEVKVLQKREAAILYFRDGLTEEERQEVRRNVRYPFDLTQLTDEQKYALNEMLVSTLPKMYPDLSSQKSDAITSGVSQETYANTTRYLMSGNGEQRPIYYPDGLKALQMLTDCLPTGRPVDSRNNAYALIITQMGKARIEQLLTQVAKHQRNKAGKNKAI